MSSLLVISDASPLISLTNIGLLHHLSDLFGKVYVPKAVYDLRSLDFRLSDRLYAQVLSQAGE